MRSVPCKGTYVIHVVPKQESRLSKFWLTQVRVRIVECCVHILTPYSAVRLLLAWLPAIMSQWLFPGGDHRHPTLERRPAGPPEGGGGCSRRLFDVCHTLAVSNDKESSGAPASSL